MHPEKLPVLRSHCFMIGQIAIVSPATYQTVLHVYSARDGVLVSPRYWIGIIPGYIYVYIFERGSSNVLAFS